MMTRRTLFGGFGAALLVSACGRASTGAVSTDAIGDKVQRLPRSQLPVFASKTEDQTLYRYAVEHGDDLQYIPCTCGCVRFGHKNNADCYIKGRNVDGTITFTSHALT